MSCRSILTGHRDVAAVDAVLVSLVVPSRSRCERTSTGRTDTKLLSAARPRTTEDALGAEDENEGRTCQQMSRMWS
jgi:hypothetical protein